MPTPAVAWCPGGRARAKAGEPPAADSAASIHADDAAMHTCETSGKGISLPTAGRGGAGRREKYCRHYGGTHVWHTSEVRPWTTRPRKTEGGGDGTQQTILVSKKAARPRASSGL